MRHLGLLLFLLLVPSLPHAAEESDAKKPSVRFDGQIMFLASTGETANERVKEFIPQGEKLQSWTRLASIREYPKIDDPKAIAGNLLRALKQQNPLAPSSIIQNPKTGDVIVDFVTWPSDQSFAEFNVFKYSKKKGGGSAAQQYAMRKYGDTTTFLKELGPLRTRIVDLMAKDGLQVLE
jgi:hypothetical protein